MRQGVRALRRVAASLLVASSFVATAQAAAPEDAPNASRRQVRASLHALERATAGVSRSLLPGAPGTIEDAIARFAPLYPNRVREGEAPPLHPGATCPREMSLVAGRVCVDRYEASLLEATPSGALEAHSPYHAPVSGHVYIAHSVPDVVPQAHISGRQAQAACRAAHKRLCEPVEWRAACGGREGFTHPYGKTRIPGACNDSGTPSVALLHASKAKRGWGNAELNDPRLNQLPNTLAKTGSSYACVNDYGLWDMVGNLHEWTADPNGTFQGGYYLDTSEHGEGCAYRTIAHDFDYHDYSIGFRCCADPE
jgi:hypothetical protein